MIHQETTTCQAPSSARRTSGFTLATAAGAVEAPMQTRAATAIAKETDRISRSPP